jgi:nucleoid-associated protein YgaU
MRKDVKIGLGIGGVLLAVLIVYALVPKNDTSNQYAHDGDAAKSAEDHGSSAAASSSTSSNPGAATGSSASTGETAGLGTTAHEPAPTTGNDHVASRDAGPAEASEEETPQATTNKIDWDKILVTGIVPEAKVPLVAHKEAEDVFGGSEPKWDTHSTGHTAAPTGTNTGTNTGAKGPQVAQANPGSHANQVAGAKPQAVKGGTMDHTVQQGENLSMIAAVAYGDARKYKEILKANPGLDERKLRPGMTIKLPDASTFAAPTPAPQAQQAKAEAKAETKIDPRSQYKVEQDDNLSRISAKLYGSTAKAKAIYEANKDKIGNDPGKLKLGTVL